MVEMSDLELTFSLFGKTPEGASKIEGLASSLQKVETCFLLVALKRFPTALSTSVAAVESLMHSSGEPKLLSDERLVDKFKAAKKKYPSLGRFSDAELGDLRDRRNEFEHRGFSPKDDSDSVRMLLEIAFPYLEACYREIHSFGLLDNLIWHIGPQWSIAVEARRAADEAGTDVRYCLDAFAHYMRYTFEPLFSVTSDFKLDEDSDELFKLRLERMELLKRKFTHEWVFDCPVCYWPERLVCELDGQRLQEKDVYVQVMGCANCSFVANRNAHPLINILLRDQIASEKEKILSEYHVF
jgi:hypothetical protein